MKAPKDKRTKEYKEWKKKYNKASEGFGDTVEKITEATGIKKAVKWIAGDDCGCDERKEKLNKIWSYRKPKCLTEEEYNTEYAVDNTSVYKLALVGCTYHCG